MTKENLIIKVNLLLKNEDVNEISILREIIKYRKQKALTLIESSQSTARKSPTDIFKSICKILDKKLVDVTSISKKRELVHVKVLTVIFLRDNYTYEMSPDELGEVVSRDRCSVLHYFDVWQNALETNDTVLISKYNLIKKVYGIVDRLENDIANAENKLSIAN